MSLMVLERQNRRRRVLSSAAVVGGQKLARVCCVTTGRVQKSDQVCSDCVIKFSFQIACTRNEIYFTFRAQKMITEVREIYRM